MRHRKRLLALGTAVLAAAGLGATAQAAAPIGGDPMITPVATGVTVRPLIEVGDRLRRGYVFEAIPDGIAIKRLSLFHSEIYVNHETSRVPFPLSGFPGPNPTGLVDFTNALVSRLEVLNFFGLVMSGSYVIPEDANYQRFCSNFLAGSEQGWSREILFTNEEATDVVNRTGLAWPAGPPYGSNPEQAGVVVAYDLESKEYRTIYGMGRHNHENSVAIPGYDEAVVLSGDDTFSAPSSQMYMYIADDADAVWNDEGHLYAFRSPEANDYGDLSGGDSVSGEFIMVPDAIADGDQSGLEAWSNANNVFQFIRIEDIAYDRNDPNVVYFADTGEPRAVPDAATTRLRRGPSGTRGAFPNGRIFRMELDPDDPKQVTSLSILLDADAGGYDNPDVMHNPDNVETTAGSLLVQEDPGSHNPYFSRLWRYDFATQEWTVLTRVNQSRDPAASPGAWEQSGVVDASAAFGPGTFLVDVQAHTLFVDTAPHPIFPGITQKREGGQLLLVRVR